MQDGLGSNALASLEQPTDGQILGLNPEQMKSRAA